MGCKSLADTGLRYVSDYAVDLLDALYLCVELTAAPVTTATRWGSGEAVLVLIIIVTVTLSVQETIKLQYCSIEVLVWEHVLLLAHTANPPEIRLDKKASPLG